MNKRNIAVVSIILFSCLLFSCQPAQVDAPTAIPQVLPSSTPSMTLTPAPSATATQFPKTNPSPNAIGTPLEKMNLLPTLDGWDYYAGHFYKLTDYSSWQEAEAQAVRWGGHLATIETAEEAQWLRTHFGAADDFWIGYNDIDHEGKWVWSNGATSTYTKWCSGEPSNADGNFEPEDAAVMNYRVGDSSLDCWNDIRINSDVQGIVEKDAP